MIITPRSHDMTPLLATSPQSPVNKFRSQHLTADPSLFSCMTSPWCGSRLPLRGLQDPSLPSVLSSTAITSRAILKRNCLKPASETLAFAFGWNLARPRTVSLPPLLPLSFARTRSGPRKLKPSLLLAREHRGLHLPCFNMNGGAESGLIQPRYRRTKSRHRDSSLADLL